MNANIKTQFMFPQAAVRCIASPNRLKSVTMNLAADLSTDDKLSPTPVTACGSLPLRSRPTHLLDCAGSSVRLWTTQATQRRLIWQVILQLWSKKHEVPDGKRSANVGTPAQAHNWQHTRGGTRVNRGRKVSLQRYSIIHLVVAVQLVPVPLEVLPLARPAAPVARHAGLQARVVVLVLHTTQYGSTASVLAGSEAAAQAVMGGVVLMCGLLRLGYPLVAVCAAVQAVALVVVVGLVARMIVVAAGAAHDGIAAVDCVLSDGSYEAGEGAAGVGTGALWRSAPVCSLL